MSRDVNWKELAWNGSLCMAWMQLTLLNCECHQSAGVVFIQQYHLIAQCTLRNVSSLQGSGRELVPCALHIWPPKLLFYMETGLDLRLLMAWQWSQALAQRQRFGPYSEGAGGNTWCYLLHLYFTVMWIVESGKFPALITEVHSGLVAEYFNCFFTLHHLRKLQISSLKPDVSIQPPTALAPPCSAIPIYKEVASKAHLCVQISPLWWYYAGDEFGSLCLLGRIQRVAPITSHGCHLWPILIMIPAQSANSSGGKNLPFVPMHITKRVFSSMQL